MDFLNDRLVAKDKLTKAHALWNLLTLSLAVILTAYACNKSGCTPYETVAVCCVIGAYLTGLFLYFEVVCRVYFKVIDAAMLAATLFATTPVVIFKSFQAFSTFLQRLVAFVHYLNLTVSQRLLAIAITLSACLLSNSTPYQLFPFSCCLRS